MLKSSEWNTYKVIHVSLASWINLFQKFQDIECVPVHKMHSNGRVWLMLSK